MPLDHFALTVPPSKFEEALSFYLKALAPLGYAERVRPVEGVVGLGVENSAPDFWIGIKEGVSEKSEHHIAFGTKDRAVVHEFHEEALKAGGTDNGSPGLRFYHPSYYAAFVRDPFGNNLEVVCHIPA
ncbi:MAG: hypothetical protein M1833_004280 [Piccolia ochrophora]|nr:MAG: hypothetical protein M1833_004280 [Piccolia ochrophora]